jgi:hypothetical protein
MVVATKNAFDGTQDLDTFTNVVIHGLESGPSESKKKLPVVFQFVAQERI